MDLPTSWFPSSWSSSSSRLSRPISVGIVLEKLFSASLNVSSRRREPIMVAEMVPTNLFLPSCKLSRGVSKAISVGMLPVNIFSCHFNSSNDDMSPTSVGIGPVMLLPRMNRAFSLVITPKADGRFPPI